MAIPEQPSAIPCAWGANTEISGIPESTSEAGHASWQAGFPPVTGQPISQGGIPPRYDDFQSILNAFSKFALYQQAGGTFAWSATQDYPAGALVRGSDNALYKANQASGPSTSVKNPVTDASGAWESFATLDDVQCDYSEVVDSDVTYSKSVPSGSAGYAQIAKLGGKTARWNQMVPNGNFTSGTTGWTATRGSLSVTNGVMTYTVSSADGTVAGNRFAVSPAPILCDLGDKLFVHAQVKITASESRAVYIFTASTTSTSGMGNAYTRATILPGQDDFYALEGINTVLDINDNGTVGYRLLFAHAAVGETLSAKNCFCVNLTKLYGKGNEPATVEDFKQTYPNDYYAYTSGELKSFGVSSVTSYANNVQIGSFEVPYAIRSLAGYGWSAGAANNYADFTAGKFVRNVAAVDLGSLTWQFVSTSGQECWYTSGLASVIKPAASKATAGNIICSAYQADSFNNVVAHASDKSVSIGASSGAQTNIQIYDADTLSMTADEFKASLAGVMLYYELNTPEETDVSSVLYSSFLPVQAGGTLSFSNVAGAGFLEDVYSEVSFLTGSWALGQCVQMALQSVPTREEYTKVVDSIDNYFTNPLGKYQLPSLLVYRPTSAGETADSSVVGGDTQYLRSMQAPFYDPFDKVLYFTKTANGSRPSGVAANKNCLWAIRWSEDPAKRVVLGQSHWGFDVISHQANGLYRPSRQDEPLIFTGARAYEDDGTVIPSEQRSQMRFVRWDYLNSPTVFETVKTVQLFSSEVLAATSSRFLCVSADMRYIVTRATASGTDTYRVYDAKQVYEAESGADVSGDYVSMFSVPTVASGQGIYCDGRYIYTLTSGSPNYTRTAIYDLNGRTVHASQARKTGGEDYADSGYKYSAEAEGYFWADWYGKTEMFEAFSLAVHDIEGNPDSWTRRDSFNLLSVPECSFLDSPLTITSDLRPLANTSSNESLILRMQNRLAPDTAYAYLTHYRNNDVADPTTTNVQQNIKIGFTETGSGTSASIGFEEYAIGDTAASSRLYPVQSNLINLGGASNLWKEVFSAASAINTSDARKKTAVADPGEALMRAWGKVNFKVFQFADAVAKKGESARLHIGVIAQQVAEAFASEGLDASRYGLFCYDSWGDECEEHTVIDKEAEYEEVTVIDAEAVYGEEGELLQPEQSHVVRREISPAVTHVERTLVRQAGDAYGIRYAEALALECAYQRWRLDRLEAMLNA